jgi:hypothetical protein
MGWHWNREKHSLSPNSFSQIVLPNNTLRVDTIEDSHSIDVVQRGQRLFNKATNSYTFDKPLTLEIYVELPFSDLAFSAKQFITIRSARLLQQRQLGSDTLTKFHEADEQRAWISLQQDELEVADGNMLYDSWSTRRIVTRGSFSRGSF